MACTTITDYVQRESGRFFPEIHKRSFPLSPWLTLVPRGTFPKAMGESLNILTYERQAPVANPTWVAMAVVDGAQGGLCLPTADKVGLGNTVRSVTLSRYVLEGPDFCSEEMRSPFELQQQLNAITKTLADYTQKVWEMAHRTDYFTYCRHKVAVLDSGPTDAYTNAGDIPAAYPATSASTHSQLTLGVLDKYKAILIRDGASESVLGKENNMPILTVMASWEVIENILTQNGERRDDIRWGQPSLLLAPFGVVGSYKGYYFLCDPWPRRFTAGAQGTYTEVLPWSTVAVWTNQGKGTKVEANPLYQTADFEETVIFDPTVYTELVPDAVGAVGEFAWTPQNYTGRWKIMNIISRDCNPDGTILYHRAIMAKAPMPINPERGVAFVHLRCDPPLGLITACAS